MSERQAEQELSNKQDMPSWVVFAAAVVGVIGALVITLSKEKPVEQLEGQPAPFFQLLDRDGNIGGYNQPGRVQVIDFWATWCPPCVKQTPAIERFRKENAHVDVISVNVDDPEDREAEIRKFLKKGPWDFPMLLDDGSASRLYKITNLPTIVVVRPDGIVHHAGTGTHSFKKLQSLADEAASE